MTQIVHVISGGSVVNAILVPAGATVSPSGARVSWDGDGLDAPEGAKLAIGPDGAGIGWTITGADWSPPASDPEPAVDLYGYAADKRWRVETGGITVAGVPVATDDRSKTMIMGARIKADVDPEYSVGWKGADGSFVSLAAPQIVAISNAVLAHVDACFAAEAAVATFIAAGDITTSQQVDDWQWPPLARYIER